jgi:choline kinase
MRELHDGIELPDEEREAGAFVWRNWDKWVGRCEEVISWIDGQVPANRE